MEILDREKSKKVISQDTGFLIGFGIFGYLSIQIVKYMICDALEVLLIANAFDFPVTFWAIQLTGISLLIVGITLLKKHAFKSAESAKLNFVYSVAALFILNIFQFFYVTNKYEFLGYEVLNSLNQFNDFITSNYLNYTSGAYIVEYISIAVICLMSSSKSNYTLE